jgi:ABC-2 type transport system ATP-binding protein
VTGAAIELRDLRKVYRKGREAVHAVDGLDLEVQRGEVFGLLGPNGAGKTTTVEMCEGLLAPTSGALRVLGLDWRRDHRELRQRIGVTLQETIFLEKQTVREIIALFRSFYSGRGRSVEGCIELLDLGEKARTRTVHLSGGQRQRLAVACALVGDPELLFLDEPTTGLDPQSRRRLWDVIRGLRADGRTVLLTTHYMEEAAHLCDRVGIVDRGRLIALGTPAALVAQLRGDHVIELTVSGAAAASVAAGQLERLPGVRATRIEGNVWTLTVEAPHVTIPPLLAHLQSRAVQLEGLTTRHTTLEDVFVGLTGRMLEAP